MKRTLYINTIKESGYKLAFIAEQIKANRTMLSRWLHNHKGSKINAEQVQRLEQFLNM